MTIVSLIGAIAFAAVCVWLCKTYVIKPRRKRNAEILAEIEDIVRELEEYKEIRNNSEMTEVEKAEAILEHVCVHSERRAKRTKSATS